MIYLCMKSIGNSKSFSLVGWIHLPKCFYLEFFALSSGTSTNPYIPLRWYFLLLYAIFILKFESFFSHKKHPTRRQYDHAQLLGVVNIRVCFMNGSMFEHDGLGITYFSIAILKDMVAS